MHARGKEAEDGSNGGRRGSWWVSRLGLIIHRVVLIPYVKKRAAAPIGYSLFFFSPFLRPPRPPVKRPRSPDCHTTSALGSPTSSRILLNRPCISSSHWGEEVAVGLSASVTTMRRIPSSMRGGEAREWSKRARGGLCGRGYARRRSTQYYLTVCRRCGCGCERCGRAWRNSQGRRSCEVPSLASVLGK